MAPSGKVTSRMPGAISRPGKGSTLGSAAGGALAGADATTIGFSIGLGGAAGRVSAMVGAGCVADGDTLDSPAKVDAGLGSGATAGAARITCVSGPLATCVGFTIVSMRFLPSWAKLPFGYLSRYAWTSPGRVECRTLTP